MPNKFGIKFDEANHSNAFKEYHNEKIKSIKFCKILAKNKIFVISLKSVF